MAIDSIPETTNSRVRGFHYDTGVWKAVAVDLSGELAIHAEISDIVQAKTSGQRIRVEGQVIEGPASGDWVPLALTSGGEILVEALAEISGGAVWASSGEIHVMSGLVAVESGEIHIMSGEVAAWVSGAVAVSGIVGVSGEVSILSGEIHVMSGEVAAQVSGAVQVSGIVGVSGEIGVLSGEIHVMSGEVAAWVSGAVAVSGIVGVSGEVSILSGEVSVSSGEIHIMSGAVGITSGAVAVSGIVGVSGEVSILSGEVSVSSGEVHVMSGEVIGKISGEAAVVLGEDYIYTSGAAASGDAGIKMPVTAMQDSYKVVTSGAFEGYAPETRLFTGADTKHIRFHETFDEDNLDEAKWDLVQGTVAVEDECAKLQHGAAIAILQTNDSFLYGVLSMEVYMEDADQAGLRFGFTGDYTGSTKDAIVEYNAGRFHTENTVETPEKGDTYTDVTLADDTWYHIAFVWTPTYAQMWVDGILRATHVTTIPKQPANIYFNTGSDSIYLYIDHVSLAPYGDIPITKQGRVPVREQGGVIKARRALVVTGASGGQALGSGEVDRVIIKVPTYNISGAATWESGLMLGVWVGGTSGDRPYPGSGCVGSGQGLLLEPGEEKELYVADLGEVYVAAETSGWPVTFIGEAMHKISGRATIY